MNLKYLAYNVFKTDYKRLNKYIKALQKEGISKREIVSDMLKSLFKYDTFLLDYFHFRYFDKDVPRDFYTNVWDMYTFQNKFNSRKHFMIFRDKRLFRNKFHEFFNYDSFELKTSSDIDVLLNWIQKQENDKVVVKEPLGAVGKGVKILAIAYQNNQLLIDGKNAHQYLQQLYHDKFVLYESFIEQHSVLKSLNPASVNTIRIITFLNDQKEVEIWGALIRMGFDHQIDNFDAGGLGANIDVETGVISSEAIIKDPFDMNVYAFHPVNGSQIKGMEIPFWKDVIQMVKNAARVVPEVRTVGWDIAITTKGPTLIEGNDNWNRVLFQLATGIGLNNRIKKMLNN